MTMKGFYIQKLIITNFLYKYEYNYNNSNNIRALNKIKILISKTSSFRILHHTHTKKPFILILLKTYVKKKIYLNLFRANSESQVIKYKLKKIKRIK